MRINYNKGTFILDSSDAVHAAMIEDFQDESKLQYFIDLLNADNNTAFQIYNSGMSFFDKDAYGQHLEQLHNDWFASIYLPLKYDHKDEIGLWKDDVDFGDEAKTLEAIYRESWKWLNNHCSNVTEETALSDKDIIEQLNSYK